MRKAVAVVLAVAILWALSLPQQAQLSVTQELPPVVLKGLTGRVQVIRDVFGIPHIYATNSRDLYMVTGFIHAQDRLFQMDVTRRQASGTLAELLGKDALASDVQLRTFGLRRAAEASLKAASPEARADLEAYALGVNAFIELAEAELRKVLIERQAGRPIPEYGALEITKIQRWDPLDSLVIGKAIAFQLSFSLDIDNTLTIAAYQAAMSALLKDPAKGRLAGAALFFEDLFRAAPAEEACAVCDAEGTAPKESAGAQVEQSASDLKLDYSKLAFDPDVLKLAADYYAKIKDIDFFKPILNRSDFEWGSNWFIVSGKHTQHGYPVLANDPHLGLSTPSIFYEMHQVIDKELNVAGVGFAGTPYVILGHNNNIVWGATTNPMDVTDTFADALCLADGQPVGTFVFGKGCEPILPIPQTFKVNVLGDGVIDNIVPVPPSDKIPAVTLIVPRRNGPVINVDLKAKRALTLQYTGFYATRELETFRVWNRAKNLAEFKEGLKFFDFGSQNWSYADIEGNIAYFTSGELPLREDLQGGFVADNNPPLFIRDGTGASTHQWVPLKGPKPSEQATPFEILPFEEMPQTVNPKNGFVVNANNDPIGTSLDNNPFNSRRPGGGIYYLSPGYDFGFRAQRITELIQAKLKSGEPIRLSEIEKIQADVMQLEARKLTPFLLAAIDAARASGAPPELAQFVSDPRIVEAQAYLKGWSFNTPTGLFEGFDEPDAATQDTLALLDPSEAEIRDSVATTIFNVWRSQLVKNTIDATLDGLSKLSGVPLSGPAQRPGTRQVVTALIHLLERFPATKGRGVSGLNFFDVPTLNAAPEVERDIIILQSLKEALDLLASDAYAKAFNKSTNLRDYRWGRLHRITFAHILGAPFSTPTDPRLLAQLKIPATLVDRAEYARGIPTDGGLGIVDNSGFAARAERGDESFVFSGGPAQRLVATVGLKEDPGLRILARNVIPGGASGLRGDRHFGDLLPLWLANDFHPVYFEREEIERNAESLQNFVP